MKKEIKEIIEYNFPLMSTEHPTRYNSLVKALVKLFDNALESAENDNNCNCGQPSCGICN